MILAFGKFELDLGRGELRRDGVPAEISRKPLDLLVYLVRHRDRTVSREELLREVWPEGAISEAALNTALRDVRRVLGDDGKQQSVVRTQRGRGIRFVADAAERPPGKRAAPSAFVGRVASLCRIDATLEAATDGHRAALLLTGEAGVGKTRLARELAARAEARGFRTYWGRSFDAEGAPPFWPWIHVLREALGATSPGRLRERLGERTRWIAPLLPDLVPEEKAPESESRFPIYAAVEALLVSLAEAGPLLLVLDDIQEADIASLELLRYLAAEEAPAPLLLATTWRDGEPAEDDPRMRVLTTLGRGERVETLALKGLGLDEMRALVAPILAHDPDPAFLASLQEQTTGNPFFVKETARHLLDSLPEAQLGETWTKGASLEAVGVAKSIRRMVERRLEAPGAECRPVLDAASVVGGEIPLALLENVASLRRTPVAKLVDRAIDAHLLEEIPGRRGHLHFAHPLIREVLYDALRVERRRDLHLEVGQALEARHPAEEQMPFAALAHHYAEAGPVALPKAVAFSIRAAREALRNYAWEDAADHLERALALQDRMPGERLPKARCELLLELTRAQRLGLRLQDARATAARALELARPLEDPVLFGHANAEFRETEWHLTAQNDASAVVALEEALERLGDAAPALRARLLGLLARDATRTNADAEPVGVEAVALARRVGDPSLLAFCLGASAMAHWRPQHLALRTRLNEEAMRLASDDQTAHFLAAANKLRAGDLAGTEAIFDEFTRRCRDPLGLAAAKARRIRVDLLQGRIQSAEQAAFEVARIGRIVGSTELSGANSLYAVRWLQGRLHELFERGPDDESALDALRSAPGALAWTAGSLLLGELHAGRVQPAREGFEKLFAGGFEPSGGPNWPLALFSLVQLCHELELPRSVPKLEERLAPFVPQHLVGSGVLYAGSSLHWMGVLAATAGRHDEALGWYERATSAYHDLKAVPWIAKLQWVQAHSLEARGGPGDADFAEKLRAEAQATAERLGIRL